MSEHSSTERSLSRPQAIVLALAAVPMVAAGAFGAVGTYSNVMTGFDRSATAFGAVAAGEGGTLVLAMVLIGLTMLGQGSPLIVRAGMWLLPMVAAAVGASVAKDVTEAIVYGITPLAMCVSAEGLGLLARRIVVYRSGQDVAARQHETETLAKIAYHRARADRHPDKSKRKRSERAVWRLASRLGTGVDPLVTEEILTTAGAWIAHGSDTALASVYGPHAAAGVTGVTHGVTQPTEALSRHDDTDASHTGHGISLADMCLVTDVTMPIAGESMTDDQVSLVLRFLRYREDPPMSYRQAADAFRNAGYGCSETRLRMAWAELVDAEATGGAA